MRKIKFRIWDKKKKEMLTNFPYENLKIESFYSRCEVMQFTGIEDKTGKEIYEKDIIKADGNKILLIVAYDNYGVPCLMSPNQGNCWDFSICGAEGVFNNCKIIGNTFENPEIFGE